MENDLNAALLAGTERVAFFIKLNRFDQYTVIEVTLAWVGENNKIEFYPCNSDYKHKYHGIVFSAQMDARKNTPYCWGAIEYDAGAVKLSRSQLEEGAKAIRSIEAKLNKLQEAEGYCTSFVERITRLARILKVKGFYVRNDGRLSSYKHGTGRLRDTLHTLIDEHKNIMDERSTRHAA
jgi:hypothetical protein